MKDGFSKDNFHKSILTDDNILKKKPEEERPSFYYIISTDISTCQ